MGTGKATRNDDPNHTDPWDPSGGRGKNAWQRGLLAVMTGGTSEIQTGGGKYKDETLADSLFPKEINNLMLNDRQAAREDADKKTEEEAEKLKPPPPPDLTSKILEKTVASSRLRASSRSGRKSTFLSNAPLFPPQK